MTTRLQTAPRWALLATLTLCLLAHAGWAQAQWKWRDKDGGVTVSDRPPPKDVADKDILTRPQAARRSAIAASAAASGAALAGGPASGKTALDKEVEARRKAAEQEQAAKAKSAEAQQAAQRAENCQRARGQLASLESGQRIARVNAKGEREVLDDQARDQETRQVRSLIASDCR